MARKFFNLFTAGFTIGAALMMATAAAKAEIGVANIIIGQR